MLLIDWIRDAKWAIDARRGKDVGGRSIGPFTVSRDCAEILRTRHESDVARLFFDHRGRTIHKWVDTLDVYDRYFAPFRRRKVAMLEIGVFRGGSLQLWRKYFGADATIFGIDIDPQCASFADRPNEVRIGSQDDPQFLRSVVSEMGRPNIVLDDGSHIGRHQEASFRTLFPLLQEGGLYVIEDLHTSYWRKPFEGGFRRRGTGVELVKQVIDDMHGWFHPRREQLAAKEEVSAVHIHESIVFIEKTSKQRPGHTKAGKDI